ncbi:MAG: hypothetical protein JWN48_5341 [Myxococcaceae bacterium]|nr:hypothetical protein [Myxococcaceae bacterium]
MPGQSPNTQQPTRSSAFPQRRSPGFVRDALAGRSALDPPLRAGDRVRWHPPAAYEASPIEAEVVEVVRTLYADLADEAELVRIRHPGGTRVAWAYECERLDS